MADRRGPVRGSRRGHRVVGVAAAAGGFLALGISPATAPSAHADLEDLIIDTLEQAVTVVDQDLITPFDQLMAALSGHDGATDALAAVATGTDPGGVSTVATSPSVDATAADTATIPLTMYRTVSPVVDLSVGGGTPIPVEVDTGSNGLTLPFWDVPFQSFFQPWDGFGTGSYGSTDAGLDYLYVKLPETLDFTTTAGQVVSDKTDVDVVLFSWPSSLESPFWSYTQAEVPNGAVGVLGIGPDALGPDTGVLPPTAGLPGALGQGVLIDESAGYLQFGPAPTGLGQGVTVNGVDDTSLDVQVNGGPIVPVHNAFIDTGGLDGSIPSSVLSNATVGQPLPAGTTISVYNDDSQPLYSYTTAPAPGSAAGLDSVLSNGPVVVDSNGMFNTGYEAFQQGPVYIDYAGGSGGGPTTTFYPGSGS